ncbi:hypothetical protein mRhiFer1_009282 [Rhinolophus ferrumequinum]|uniref:Uncharacterized protein n=1 Tax=Rhinolophus ferrumequinum TaxID=59479 RepID=A0A7J7RXP5_RHIFE|nr:hypothetical protein mRhiFer1_009282 [Rhinolophus ferrumequinum]
MASCQRPGGWHPHSAHSCECARTLCHYPTQQRTPSSGRSPAMKVVLPLPRGDSPSCPFPLQTFTKSSSFEQVLLPLTAASRQPAPRPPGLILEKCPHGWLRDLSPSAPDCKGQGMMLYQQMSIVKIWKILTNKNKKKTP